MAEEREQEKTTAGAPPAGDLGEELKRLGKQLSEAAKAVWESEASRNLQKQISEGLTELAQQLDTVAKKIVASEEARKLREQAGRVVESAKQADIGDEVRRGLLTGLQELNAQLEKLIIRLREEEQKEKEAGEPPAPEV